MEQPLVSVVVPTFNRCSVLMDAIESVLSQTYSNVELIVVDDGSSDQTAASLAGIADPRLRVFFEPHCGNKARVRNIGIEAARGQWIAFIDSDDLWFPAKLDKQLTALLTSEQYGWSYTGFVLIDETGRKLDITTPLTSPSGWILDALLAYKVAAPLPSLVVKRQLLETVGLLVPRFQHDDIDHSHSLCEDGSGAVYEKVIPPKISQENL